MSHEIESMFYQGEKPWHGLGVETTGAMTAEQAMHAAGLDWRVNLVSLMTPDGRKAAPWTEDDEADRVPYRATVRATDNRILGVVGPDYAPLQNADAFRWFDPWIANGQASYHTAGSLRGGRRVWVLAKLSADPLDVVRGDAVLPFVLLSNAHDGSMSVRAGFTPIRVVCANTLGAAHNSDASKLLRIKHTGDVKETLTAIRGIMDAVRGEFTTTAEQWRHLARRELDKRTLE